MKRALVKKIAFLLAVAAHPGISIAAVDVSRAPELATGSIVAQVLTGLGFVTIAIFALAWLAKRLGGARLMQHNAMEVISSMPMGTREKVVLIQVENTKILLGVTSNNIARLHVFDATSVGDENAQQDDESNCHENTGHKNQDKAKWNFTHYLKQFSQTNNRASKEGSLDAIENREKLLVLDPQEKNERSGKPC